MSVITTTIRGFDSESNSIRKYALFFQLRHHLKPLEQTHGFILPPGLFRLIGASWARGSIFGQVSEAGPGENYGLV